MLRTLLIAAALLTATGTSFAHGGGDGYGRVVSVEPHFVISFGSPYPDGFSVLYETGGARYWTHTPYYPGPTIVLPHRVQRVYYRDDGHGWDDRRNGHARRDDWRDEHREHRRWHHDDDD